jgi:hypothetical protein
MRSLCANLSCERREGRAGPSAAPSRSQMAGQFRCGRSRQLSLSAAMSRQPADRTRRRRWHPCSANRKPPVRVSFQGAKGLPRPGKRTLGLLKATAGHFSFCTSSREYPSSSSRFRRSDIFRTEFIGRTPGERQYENASVAKLASVHAPFGSGDSQKDSLSRS